jgi:hypothetical protein
MDAHSIIVPPSASHERTVRADYAALNDWCIRVYRLIRERFRDATDGQRCPATDNRPEV